MLLAGCLERKICGSFKISAGRKQCAGTHTRSKWVVFNWAVSLLNFIFFDMKRNTTNLIQSNLCKRRYPDDSSWSLGNLKNNRNSKRQFAFSGILISPVLPCPPISSRCLSAFPETSPLVFCIPPRFEVLGAFLLHPWQGWGTASLLNSWAVAFFIGGVGGKLGRVDVILELEWLGRLVGKVTRYGCIRFLNRKPPLKYSLKPDLSLMCPILFWLFFSTVLKGSSVFLQRSCSVVDGAFLAESLQ